MPATILVVDDDQTIRELLQLHLRNAGYAVHVAEDAVEAGHLVLRSPPDLIISDVTMPIGSVTSGVTSKGHWLATLCGRISVRCSGRSPKRSLRWPAYAR